MKYKFRVDWYIWLYPAIFFLIVVFGIRETHGTDLGAQLFALESVGKENLSFLIESLFSEDSEIILYHIIYNILHNYMGISARLYIGFITLAYFVLLIFMMKEFFEAEVYRNLSRSMLNGILLFTILSLCPVLVTISRNFCAVVFLYASILFFMKKMYIIALIPLLLALWVHEGIKLMYVILIMGLLLYYIWFRNVKNILIRNTIVVVVCVFLLYVGNSIFSTAAALWFENGLLSEHYLDMYGTARAGDGTYKLVIVLSMLGPLICLFINCMLDKRNDIIYGIAVSGLFMICMLCNFKIFYVQRLMMFMPFFIGFTSFHICYDYISREGRINQLYLYVMWLIPANVFFQYIIQFDLYFGNF